MPCWFKLEHRMTLTQKQRRHLSGLAHHLKPVVIVGQHGLSDGVFNELDIALDTHELVKVRVNAGDREQRGEMIAAISERNAAQLVQSIGHVAVFYRRHPEQPKIKLA